MANQKWFNLVLVSAVILTVTPPPAHAYIDPGSGSYVIQVALASIFGFIFVLKTYWMNLKNLIVSMFSKSQPKNAAPQQGETR